MRKVILCYSRHHFVIYRHIYVSFILTTHAGLAAHCTNDLGKLQNMPVAISQSQRISHLISQTAIRTFAFHSLPIPSATCPICDMSSPQVGRYWPAKTKVCQHKGLPKQRSTKTNVKTDGFPHFIRQVACWVTICPLKLSFKLGFKPNFHLKPN